ncbi:MAG: hypothetical protein GYB33_12480 [Gammaproteobacteria bacterium]|nr:hypothetical protein [Gammaproteobacteria bacterium]
MIARRIAILGGSLAVVCYPLFVYLGLQHLDSRWISLMMLAIVSLRLLNFKTSSAMTVALVCALAAATIITFVSGSEIGLLLYPVLANFVLFVLFMSSWVCPPTIIERIARLKEPDLPAHGVTYTRHVTLVWCLFFAINGSLAAYSITVSREWWALYNGFISYLLMAALFLVEVLLRGYFKEKKSA